MDRTRERARMNITDYVTIALYFIQTKLIMSIHSRAILKIYQKMKIKKHLKYIKNKSEYFKDISIRKGLDTLPCMNKK